MCTPTPNHPPVDFMAQATNCSLLGFEVQTKKSTQWFWHPSHQTGATGFEAQTRKPSPLVLRLNPKTRCDDFETQITKVELLVLRLKPKNHRTWFWPALETRRRKEISWQNRETKTGTKMEEAIDGWNGGMKTGPQISRPKTAMNRWHKKIPKKKDHQNGKNK
jgi:hypothetical protein